VDVGARKQFRVSAGMVVPAEFNLGIRTVLKYLLSPVGKMSGETRREMQVRAIQELCSQAGRPAFVFLPSPSVFIVPVCRSLITIVKTFCQ
jgi:hypothetical protein